MIDLGSEVECLITGFVGIATARLEHINGEVEYAVTPKRTDQGKYPRIEYISATRLKKIGDGITIEREEIKMGFGGSHGKN